MTKYTVELTDSEVKAMGFVMYSIQDWIDNAVKNRARRATDQIYNIEVERMTDDPEITSIPADKNQVVLDADIESVKDKMDREEEPPAEG